MSYVILIQCRHSSRAMKQWKKLKHGRLIAIPGPYKRHTSVVDKTKVLCLVLHCADVAHPTKAWDLHKEWTARCMEEFFNQGDREKEMGLDVSPLCDRTTTKVPQSQIGKSFFFCPQLGDLEVTPHVML